MDKNFTIVDTSNLAAVRGGAHIYSLVADEDIQNGSIGYVGVPAEEFEGVETYEFGVFDKDTLNQKKAVLVANPEWNYEDGLAKQALSKYTNKAGVPFVALDLVEGDKFRLSEEGFDATGVDALEKGQFVVLTAGDTKLKVVATEAETEGCGFVGRIDYMAKTGYGWITKSNTVYGMPINMWMVKVIKNERVAKAATGVTE